MEYFFNFEKLNYVSGKKPEGCILCLLRDGSEEVVNLTVYSDDSVMVSVNLYPYNPGHIMVFPRRHVEDLRECSLEEESRIWSVTRHALDLLDSTHNPAGYNVGYNMHPVAGASVRHLHLHIIPRYPNELGVADLLAGKRVLVESPTKTQERLREAFEERPPAIDGA